MEKMIILQKLNLSYNDISDISALSVLTNLQELDLHNNRL
jgi:Leucine-rich repeat (LRR) protein